MKVIGRKKVGLIMHNIILTLLLLSQVAILSGKFLEIWEL
jgi:hypothetical protein